MKKFWDNNIVQIILLGSFCLLLNCKIQSKGYYFYKKISLEGEPSSLAASDLNQDGHQDLIVTDIDDGTIIVLLGDGKGELSMSSGSPFEAGHKPDDIAIGDFNNDNKNDIAIANHEATYITLLLGNGKGQFSPSPSSPISVNSNPHPHGIAAGDFNGDRKLDLALESWQDNEVIVLYGDGKGAFLTLHERHKVGPTPYYKLRSGNFNNDKYADIITSNWGGASISLLFGSDTSTHIVEIPTSISPFSVGIGDLNGDDNADIGIAHRRGNANQNDADKISIFLGNGTGFFREFQELSFDCGKAPTSVAIGDYDGNGINDLAIANYSSGDVSLILGSKTKFNQANNSPFIVEKGLIAVVFADLDEDKKEEIITVSSISNTISIISSLSQH